MSEAKHFISISPSSDRSHRYLVGRYCHYVEGETGDATFKDVRKAYEYAKWQSEKQGLGLRFSGGVDKLIFPDAYKETNFKPKKKKKKEKK